MYPKLLLVLLVFLGGGGCTVYNIAPCDACRQYVQPRNEASVQYQRVQTPTTDSATTNTSSGAAQKQENGQLDTSKFSDPDKAALCHSPKHLEMYGDCDTSYLMKHVCRRRLRCVQ